MPDLSKIGERGRLRPKRGDEPHWQRLRQGCYIGFRPSKREGPGTWFARAYDPDRRKYQRKPLGDYGILSGHEVFAQAKRDAEAWAETVESGGVRTIKLITVGDACASYLRERPGKIAEGVFRRHVFADPIAKVKLDKLRRHHLWDWRKRLEAAPAVISRSKNGERRTKRRAKSTVNRDMVPLRAALMRVLQPGPPSTDAAWQEALRPFKGVDRPRELYLDRVQRKQMLDACEESAKPFVQALCMLPLRPGALAGLVAGDFEERTRSLKIGRDKNGQPRQIAVPPSIAEFLKAQRKGKLPKAPIFSRPDGKKWDKDTWKHPIKRAAQKGGLPLSVTAYTLRHSVITDLIRAGLPALTVGQLSGTSIAMIERHYGHLVQDDAEKALASLAF